MLFSSLTFLYYFLPLTLIFYLIVCLIMLAVYPVSYAKNIDLSDEYSVNVEKAKISNGLLEIPL